MRHCFLTIVLLGFGSPFLVHGQKERAHEQPPPLLEVRLTKPLQWINDCLNVSIDRVNRSESTFYIPDMGLYMYSSVVYSAKAPEEDGRQGWIGLYGWFDVVSLQATPLAPGATRHDDICYISSSIAVVNREQTTDRNIPVRGKLKISAYYFMKREDWLKNKAQQEGHHLNFQGTPGETDKTNPYVTSIEVVIPCTGVGCRPGCDRPPVIFNGEVNYLFHFSEPEWKARGEAINKELVRKSAACSEANPSSPK